MLRIPGTDSMVASAKPRLLEEYHRIAREGGESEFPLAVALFEFFERDNESSDAFERQYGPMFASGSISNEDYRRAFVELFPGSPFVAGLHQLMNEERAARQKAQAEAVRQARVESAWEGLMAQGDEIAQLFYRRAWFIEYSPNTPIKRHKLLELDAYLKMLTKGRFCPAKSQWTKEHGAPAYQQRAKEHCNQAPPSDDLGTGQRTLTEECRWAFLSSC